MTTANRKRRRAEGTLTGYWALKHYLDHPELRKVTPDPHFLATVSGDVNRLAKQLEREWERHYPLSEKPRTMIDFKDVVWR